MTYFEWQTEISEKISGLFDNEVSVGFISDYVEITKGKNTLASGLNTPSFSIKIYNDKTFKVEGIRTSISKLESMINIIFDEEELGERT